jgi:DNA polymerase-3 subunit delta'
MWQGVRDHDDVVEGFRRTLAAGRLASTYLFVGPDGVGKRMFALELAKSLLCSESDPAALAPCGRCQSCLLCDAGTHPDIHYVETEPGTKNLKVSQFIGDDNHRNQQGFCHEISLRPLMSGRRIGIIDDADWFTVESANSLLKVLEEPPPGSVIILLGTSRSRQLPTILSRSQIVRFGPLSEETLAELIRAEGLAADAGGARALAERSAGSLALARDRADPEALRMRELFAAAWRRGADGSGGGFDSTSLARPLDEFISAGGKEAAARRGRFRQVLLLAGEVLRGEIRGACDGGYSPEVALAALDRCLTAEEQLDRNANQATLLECWLDDLAAIPAAASIR